MCRQQQDWANSLRNDVQRGDRCRAAQRPACAQRQRGFTLLEAVVAMVLISGAGAALFAWINSELGALARVQQSDARADAMVNAVEFMHTVNPMLSPEGKVTIAGYTLVWKATAVSAVQDGVSYPRGVSLYQLALYDNYVTVQQTDGTRWFDFTLRQVGYKRVREIKFF